MPHEPRWRRYLRFHFANRAADLTDELQDHLQSTIESLVAQGMPIDEARREACRRFGDVDRIRDEVTQVDREGVRAATRARWIGHARQDIAYAWRQLRRAPSFTIVAAIAIGLGVGLNVAIFSVMNGMLLRPLPGVRDDGLRRVYVNHHSPFDYKDLAWARDHVTLVQAVVGERMTALPVDIDGAPERIVGAFATQGFFQTLGVRMALGRAFDVNDRRAGEDVAVLSNAMWRTRYNGDASIVGRTIRIADRPFTIVGVAPPEFMSSVFGWAPSLWIPLASVAAVTGTTLDDFGGNLYATARMVRGASDAAAASQLTALVRRRIAGDTTRRGELLVRLDNMRGVNAELRTPIALAGGGLFAMVALVLLIACANVANMLLGRASARRVEIGVRLALGASRSRLLRQLLTESLVLAIVGGGLGIGGALLLIRAITGVLPALPEVSLDLAPDWRVFAFAFALCLASAVLFGFAPALRATSTSLSGFLRADASPRRTSRLRNALVAGQVALCVLLLGVTAALARSFVQSRAVDPGIVTAGVTDLQLDLGAKRDAANGEALYQRIAEHLAATPGVASVGFAEIVPLSGSNMETHVVPDGATFADPRSTPKTYFNVVGGSYFGTLGMRIVRGRDFNRNDAPRSTPVMIVNETAARRWWPGMDPVGKRLRWGGADGELIEVVGVAHDAKYNSYGEDPASFVYLPLAQRYRSQMVAHVRAAGAVVDQRTLMQSVRDADLALAPPTAKPLSEEIALALLPSRIGAALAGAFGAVALLLAASGIYGVVSYMVARRTREIGIRTALGATRATVVRLVIRDGMRSVAIGAIIGLTLASALAFVLSRVLYGVTALDPAVFLGAPGALIVIALVACWLPAHRAAQISPTIAMRAE